MSLRTTSSTWLLHLGQTVYENKKLCSPRCPRLSVKLSMRTRGSVSPSATPFSLGQNTSENKRFCSPRHRALWASMSQRTTDWISPLSWPKLSKEKNRFSSLLHPTLLARMSLRATGSVAVLVTKLSWSNASENKRF